MTVSSEIRSMVGNSVMQLTTSDDLLVCMTSYPPISPAR